MEQDLIDKVICQQIRIISHERRTDEREKNNAGAVISTTSRKNTMGRHRYVLNMRPNVERAEQHSSHRASRRSTGWSRHFYY